MPASPAGVERSRLRKRFWRREASVVTVVVWSPNAPTVNTTAELRGLSTLKERVGDNGGELKVEQTDGRFLTAAAFEHLPSTTPPSAARED